VGVCETVLEVLLLKRVRCPSHLFPLPLVLWSGDFSTLFYFCSTEHQLEDETSQATNQHQCFLPIVSMSIAQCQFFQQDGRTDTQRESPSPTLLLHLTLFLPRLESMVTFGAATIAAVHM
jgi:hypothetical protein